MEYQLNAILKKYDLRDDDQKVKYLQESAELICTLGSSVQREVYAGRVAEVAKISMEAMKLEVNRAFKRRTYKEKKQQEKIDLSPVRNLQPKSRHIHYDNTKSAVAEETVLGLCFREPALLDQVRELKPEMFSCPLFGRVYDQMCRRHAEGMTVSLGGLTELDGEEMSHIAYVFQKQEGPVNEQVLQDCAKTILREYQAKSVVTDEDIRAHMERMKKSKGYKA